MLTKARCPAIAASLMAGMLALSACTGGGGASSSSSPAPLQAAEQKGPSVEQLLKEAQNSALPPQARKNFASQLLRDFPNAPEAAKAKELLLGIEEELIGQQWTYMDEEEAMTGKRSTAAAVTSSNTFEFDFPYQGTQRANLLIRKHASHGKDVIFALEKGQIECNSRSCPIRIRFDDKPPVTFNGTEPADNSSETVFIPAYSTFMRELPKTKRLLVEVIVYHQGVIVAEFDVSGFKPDKMN